MPTRLLCWRFLASLTLPYCLPPVRNRASAAGIPGEPQASSVFLRCEPDSGVATHRALASKLANTPRADLLPPSALASLAPAKSSLALALPLAPVGSPQAPLPASHRQSRFPRVVAFELHSSWVHFLSRSARSSSLHFSSSQSSSDLSDPPSWLTTRNLAKLYSHLPFLVGSF